MKITPRRSTTTTTTTTTTVTPSATSTATSTTTKKNQATTTLPPLPRATKPLSTPNTSALSAKTWTKKAYATPQTAPLPPPLSTSATALAQTLAPLLSADVAGHRYDTSAFALQLLAHLEGHDDDRVAAFRSFAPSALAAWNDGGSSCVGHCLSLVARLRARGLPAALVPVSHPGGQGLPHEPPFAHVAVVVPIVDDGPAGPRRGVVVCDTGNNVAAPAVLFPGVPVTVPLGDGARSFTYELASDGKSVAVRRPLPGGVETSTLSLVELLNPDACLTAPYAAMNPLVTLCARDGRGGVVASVVVDLEAGLLRCSFGPHKTRLAFADVDLAHAARDLGRVVDDDFARAFGTTAPALIARLAALLRGAPALNALRLALEGGAA